MIISSSRDRSVLVWRLTPPEHHSTNKEVAYGVPSCRLTGHFNFVQDVVLSSDGQFALSGSWDRELHLWDINTGVATRRFVGHTKDVLSVAFSIDNRQIVSKSQDPTIKLWNTLGECKFTIQDGNSPTEWVSCVRVSTNTFVPTIVSESWDRTVRVWNLIIYKVRCTLAVMVGMSTLLRFLLMVRFALMVGKMESLLLWDLAEDKKLYSLDAGGITHALCFSPNRYWLCAATEHNMMIWDMESKSIVEDLMPNLTVRAGAQMEALCSLVTPIWEHIHIRCVLWIFRLGTLTH